MTEPASVSPLCAREQHSRCLHTTPGGRVNLWQLRRRDRRSVSLCGCSCHRTCPLAGQPAVPRSAWLQQCTCPGAAAPREAAQRAQERAREVAEVVKQASAAGPLDAEDIRRRMTAVYEAHGERPPPLTAMSNLLAAGTAPRGTRNLRLLWLVIRSVARGIRWAWQPDPDGQDPNRAQLRNGYRSAGALAGIALLLTAAAFRWGGRRRLAFSAAAAGTGLLAAWSITLLTGISQLTRYIEQHSETTPRRTGDGPPQR